MGRNSKKRGKGGDNNKNVIFIAIGVIAVAVVAVYLLMPGKKHRIDDEIGVVQEVVSGNTIRLQNGLTVEMLGIKEGNSSSVSFLNGNVVGKRVHLKADNSNTRPYYENAARETVRAYVNMEDLATFKNVNGYMLQNKQADLNSSYCTDSLSAYQSYITDPEPGQPGCPNPGSGVLLSEVDLSKKMSAATFLIVGDMGVVGTGFFIYKNGLALTNYHVLSHGDTSNYRIFLSDEEGNITPDRDRPFHRLIVYSSKLDYAIFNVSLDSEEEVPYLDLAKERPARGTKVGVVGNPATDSGVHLATFSTGTISALPSENEIQFNAPITHGNSGGPVCDYYGRVVGITKSTAVDDGRQSAANINFGVDILKVREVLDGLKDVKTYGGK